MNIARHLAMKPDERIGSLLVNPGGPGFGATEFAVLAESNFGQPLLDHFDIVAWDPRGTGLSEPPIDCIDDYDHFFATADISPDDQAERQQLIDLAAEFTTDCVDKNADYYQYVGTNNSARDMDAIRAALGEATISYLGFSYGSELGATWATLFPAHRARRCARRGGRSRRRFGGARRAAVPGLRGKFDVFLASCSADATCAFNNGGDAEGAFDRLMTSLDTSPIPSVDGRPLVSIEVAKTAVGEAMYTDTRWPQLAEALAAAQSGDGTGLLALYDEYYVRRAGRHLRQLAGGLPGDQLHGHARAPDDRGGRCQRGEARSGRPPILDEDRRQLLLHVLPSDQRSADRDHR